MYLYTFIFYIYTDCLFISFFRFTHTCFVYTFILYIYTDYIFVYIYTDCLYIIYCIFIHTGIVCTFILYIFTGCIYIFVYIYTDCIYIFINNYTYLYIYLHLQVLFVLSLVYPPPLVLNSYTYPDWATVVGWLITGSSLIPIPAYIIYRYFKTPLEQRKVCNIKYTKPPECVDIVLRTSRGFHSWCPGSTNL